MPLSASDVARLVQGELIGRGDISLAGVAPLDQAGPGELAFLTSTEYLPSFHRSTAGAVLVTPQFRAVTDGPATRIVVPDAQRALHRVLAELYPSDQPAWGIHPSATLGRGARWRGRIAVGAGAVLGAGVTLGADCIIGAHAVLQPGARLGAACRIGDHATIGSGATLGDHVTVHAGARVGGEGFRFTVGERGAERLPHVGRCRIGDEVEIGANTTIDRGSVGDTVIGPGTKIDNLVHIAHNVRIGSRCIILAQAGIAGSTLVEDDALIAGQAGLAGHLTVGRGARVAGQSGVIGDVPAGATVSGYPARTHREVLRQAAALRRLAPLVDRLERLAHHDHAQ